MKGNILKFFLFPFLIAGLAYSQPLPRERARKQIETIRMWKLTEALNLSQEQSMKFFPLFNQFQRENRKLDQERNRLLDQLQDVLAEKRPKEKKLRTLLKMVEENRIKKGEGQRDFWLQASKILTVRQRAELLIFQRDFERQIREIIKGIREHRGERR